MESWENQTVNPEAGDVVRAAEQTVGEAWMARLLLAESETEAVLGACARARGRAAERVRAAQEADDLGELVRAQTDLETADTAWRQAWEEHERTRADLARELSLWSEGIARHVQRAWAEQSRAGRG